MNLSSREDDVFLKRLTAIVEANLSDERFGVKELAVKMGISRSQIHRKLKSKTKQSVSQFIREIRLKKAKELLEKENLTVSEIAYNVGFGSPSYFIKCFHEYFGYAPGEFLKYAPESLKKGENGNHNKIFGKLKSKITFYQKPKFLLLVALILVCSGVVIYFVVQYLEKENNLLPTDKSIAILPLKNSGNDPEVQKLADGIVEDILNRLSQVSVLTVKSRNSSEKYRSTLMTTPEIAEEMGVSYLAEGTILKEGENVRIYIQLIDAVNDVHLWSEQFDRDLSGIFTFISDVSRQIAEELKAELSAVEMNQIEKVYTQNPEAYLLYLKGHYFWYRRTLEDLKKSIDYFNQALIIDPDYSLAYAGLANAYFIMAYWQWMPGKETWEKSKEFALKSLQIDNKLVEAHAVLGGIATWYDMNWEVANRELKLAIELDPNNAIAHQYYAEFLKNRGDFKEAINELNLALKLYPNAPAIYAVRAYCYYDTGKFNEALNDMKKVSELNRYYLIKNFLNFKIYFRQGEDLNAINELETIVSIYDPEMDLGNKLKDIYSNAGMEGIIYWTTDWLSSKKSKDNSTGLFNDDKLIAELYSLTGESDSVLVSLQRFYKTSSVRKLSINNSIDFKFLNDDPRFIALLKQMNL